MTSTKTKPKAKAKSIDPEMEAIQDALKQANEAREFAVAELAEFDTVQTFEILEAVADKSGEFTKVITLSTDADAVIELFMFEGNPFSVDTAEAGIAENKPLVVEFLRAMSNIDLTDQTNLKSIGWSGISKAREAVRSFFMLRFISDLDLKSVATN